MPPNYVPEFYNCGDNIRWYWYAAGQATGSAHTLPTDWFDAIRGGGADASSREYRTYEEAMTAAREAFARINS